MSACAEFLSESKPQKLTRLHPQESTTRRSFRAPKIEQKLDGIAVKLGPRISVTTSMCRPEQGTSQWDVHRVSSPMLASPPRIYAPYNLMNRDDSKEWISCLLCSWAVLWSGPSHHRCAGIK
ncbi:hypothetical protein PM082_018720 [Marasmius tenuissimus]|nr:hypothetical protein PM082_018720 [Marasmius tenuissimus]